MRQLIHAAERPLINTDWIDGLRVFADSEYNGTVTIYEQGFVLDVIDKRLLEKQDIPLGLHEMVLTGLKKQLGRTFDGETEVPTTGITYLEPRIKSAPWPLIVKVAETPALVAEHNALASSLGPYGVTSRARRRFSLHIGEIVGRAFSGDAKVTLRYALSDRCSDELLLGKGKLIT